MPSSCNSTTHRFIENDALPTHVACKPCSQLLANLPPDPSAINGMDVTAKDLASLATNVACNCLSSSSLLPLELISS